jgi:hypothetical protein
MSGIFEKKNCDGDDHDTLTVNTGSGRLSANLGRFPGQGTTTTTCGVEPRRRSADKKTTEIREQKQQRRASRRNRERMGHSRPRQRPCLERRKRDVASAN